MTPGVLRLLFKGADRPPLDAIDRVALDAGLVVQTYTRRNDGVDVEHEFVLLEEDPQDPQVNEPSKAGQSETTVIPFTELNGTERSLQHSALCRLQRTLEAHGMVTVEAGTSGCWHLTPLKSKTFVDDLRDPLMGVRTPPTCTHSSSDGQPKGTPKPVWRFLQGEPSPAGRSRLLSDLSVSGLSVISPLGVTVCPNETQAATKLLQLRSQFETEFRGNGDGAPRVLVVARRFMRKSKQVNFVGELHLDLIQLLGGAPIILPRASMTLETLAMYMPMNGFMIVEGEDVSADLEPYGSDADEIAAVMETVSGLHSSDATSDSCKDRVELELLHRALREKIPYLGICRGAQMANVFKGGSLYVDVNIQQASDIKHVDYDNYDDHRHEVRVLPDTPLAVWYKESLDEANCMLVNSYHHQGVRTLADGLAPLCFSLDGLVEGFADLEGHDPNNGRFCVGLQFHPERMLWDHTGNLRVYADFMRACWNHRRLQLASGNSQ